MEEKPEHLSPEEELQADNEIKSLNLELRYGALHTQIGEDAPPELVSQWLDNVTGYEEKYAKAEKISIHEFIGKPTLRPVSAIENDEFESEIDRLTNLLQEHFVMTGRPEHLSPKGYYRFLSEEFMQHGMTNFSAPGMVHYFAYDEFHRDGPAFIQAHVGDFIQDLMSLERPYEGIWLSEHLRDDYNEITKAEALERIHIFRASYRKIEFGKFVPIKLEATPTGMFFLFQAEWFGTPVREGRAQEHHEGLGVIQLDFENGDWLVQGVMMPGFKF